MVSKHIHVQKAQAYIHAMPSWVTDLWELFPVCEEVCTKIKNKSLEGNMVVHTHNSQHLGNRTRRIGVQDHSLLYSKFKVSLDYMRRALTTPTDNQLNKHTKNKVLYLCRLVPVVSNMLNLFCEGKPPQAIFVSVCIIFQVIHFYWIL